MIYKSIVNVGGRFCGTVLAANLLRRPPSDATEIVLIERGGETFLPRALYGDYLQEVLLQGTGRPRPRPSSAITQRSLRRISPNAASERSSQTCASRSKPVSKRLTSSRVLYIEMPVRSRPPRSARP